MLLQMISTPAAFVSRVEIHRILLLHCHALLKPCLRGEQFLILVQLLLRNFDHSFLVNSLDCILPNGLQLCGLNRDGLREL